MGRIPGCRNRAYNRKRVYPQFCVDTAKRCKIELEYFKAGAAPAAPAVPISNGIILVAYSTTDGLVIMRREKRRRFPELREV